MHTINSLKRRKYGALKIVDSNFNGFDLKMSLEIYKFEIIIKKNI